MEDVIVGIEVSLAMLGNVCEVLGELAEEVERPDLVAKVSDTLNMASDVLEQSR